MQFVLCLLYFTPATKKMLFTCQLITYVIRTKHNHAVNNTYISKIILLMQETKPKVTCNGTDYEFKLRHGENAECPLLLVSCIYI